MAGTKVRIQRGEDGNHYAAGWEVVRTSFHRHKVLKTWSMKCTRLVNAVMHFSELHRALFAAMVGLTPSRNKGCLPAFRLRQANKLRA